MKLTTLFVGFVAVISYTWNFRISATATDRETRQHKFYDNYMNFVWNCDTNADCTTPESSCVENKCQCPPNFIFNAAMTSCLKAAEKYGDACEETLQCTAYLQSGGNCIDGICTCATGYHYLHGRCNKSSGLKEKCRSDDDCYVNVDYEALSCTNEICRCSDGFYQREYRTCRREAKEIGAECMIDLDCTFNDNAQCDKTKGCFIASRTSENKTFQVSKTEALRTIGPSVVNTNYFVEKDCTIDKECEHLGAAATCGAAGKCICKPGYFLDAKMTRCVPELGEKCMSTDAVSIKNSICRDGQWNCKGANVPSINNRKCLKVTRAYNTSCTQHEQCYVFGPDASCVKKKCLCNENSHYSEEQMFCWINKGVGESCQRDLDCYVKGFDSVLSCTDKSICECPMGTHINAAGTACIDDKAALGDPCTADDDCGNLKNSMCKDNSCSCIDNYYESMDECVSGINASCRNDIDCKPDNSTCDFGKCICEEGFVSPFAAVCVQVSSFGGACQYDVQCSATSANALCLMPEFAQVDESAIGTAISVNGTCSCDTGHHYIYGKCFQTKVLRESCTSRGECYVESDPATVVCRKGVCNCNWSSKEINQTFCQNVASSKMVLSSSIGITMIVLRFVDIL